MPKVVVTLNQDQFDTLSNLNKTLIDSPAFFDSDAEHIYFALIAMMAMHLISNCPDELVAPSIAQITIILPSLYLDLKPLCEVGYPTIS